MKISKATAKDMLKGSKGKFVSVGFVKKNGDDRKLNGRLGVHNSKHAPLKGVGLAYNPDDYYLVGIFDVQAKDYRMVNLETLYQLKVDGETYDVS